MDRPLLTTMKLAQPSSETLSASPDAWVVQAILEYEFASERQARFFAAVLALGPSLLPEPQRRRSESVRKAERFHEGELMVRFRTDYEFVTEHAMNICNGSMFIRTALRPEVDTVVKVDVEFPNAEHVKGTALVAGLRDFPVFGGVMLKLLDEDPRLLNALDHYLMNLAQPVSDQENAHAGDGCDR